MSAESPLLEMYLNGVTLRVGRDNASQSAISPLIPFDPPRL
jgi:hypothetical protein